MKKLIFLFTLLLFVFPAITAYARELPVITVSGEASVAVEPDVAFVFLGVETQDASALESQIRNNAIMENVIAAILATGIDESDIQTARFNMHPMHDWNTLDGNPRVIGYMVSNSVSVTVRDIDRVGAVLGAATEAGANAASNISFGLLDSSEPYNQALAQAVADATTKAQVIAASLGINLGNVQHVVEIGSTGFMPMPRAEAMFAAGAFFAQDMAISVPMHGGELDIIARVQVTFEIAR